MAVEQDIYISDEFKQIVERTSAALQTKLGKSIKFFFGEDEHVIDMMMAMTRANADKYPMVALVLPVDIEHPHDGGYYGTAILPRIVIATVTDDRLPPAQRLENYIKPVIMPVKNELLKQISKQSTFAVMSPDHIECTERIRYGTQAAAQGFKEYIDGMELLDMKLTLNKKCL